MFNHGSGISDAEGAQTMLLRMIEIISKKMKHKIITGFHFNHGRNQGGGRAQEQISFIIRSEGPIFSSQLSSCDRGCD